jgi:hypothetical protein
VACNHLRLDFRTTAIDIPLPAVPLPRRSGFSPPPPTPRPSKLPSPSWGGAGGGRPPRTLPTNPPPPHRHTSPLGPPRKGPPSPNPCLPSPSWGGVGGGGPSHTLPTSLPPPHRQAPPHGALLGKDHPPPNPHLPLPSWGGSRAGRPPRAPQETATLPRRSGFNPTPPTPRPSKLPSRRGEGPGVGGHRTPFRQTLHHPTGTPHHTALPGKEPPSAPLAPPLPLVGRGRGWGATTHPSDKPSPAPSASPTTRPPRTGPPSPQSASLPREEAEDRHLPACPPTDKPFHPVNRISETQPNQSLTNLSTCGQTADKPRTPCAPRPQTREISPQPLPPARPLRHVGR